MKYVESYWVEELPNGVIHLLINCTQKEIYYHSFSANWFVIAGTEEEYDNWKENDVILNTESFLPQNKDITYIMTFSKEKDQLSFYWIPFERGKRKDRKILLEFNRTRNANER